jgi:hypothetical protein
LYSSIASSLAVAISRRFLWVSSALSIMSFPSSTSVPLPDLAACLSCSFVITPLSNHTCSSSRYSAPYWLAVSLMYSFLPVFLVQ